MPHTEVISVAPGVAPLILVLMVANSTMAVVAKKVKTIKAAATKVVAIKGKRRQQWLSGRWH
jgi:hypothetical protein